MLVKPEIPSDQVERLQPVVGALLVDLRRHTAQLTAENGLPLDFRLEPEGGS